MDLQYPCKKLSMATQMSVISASLGWGRDGKKHHLKGVRWSDREGHPTLPLGSVSAQVCACTHIAHVPHTQELEFMSS